MHAVPVVPHDHPVDALNVICQDVYLDNGRLGVERVPDHLRDRAARVLLPRQPQHVIRLGIQVDLGHECSLSQRPDVPRPVPGCLSG